MSASLIILIPAILLGIVGMFCFVGCKLPVEGLPGGPTPPFTSYTGTTILLNKDCIAYWPLKEGPHSVTAIELISRNDGNYIDQNTVPDKTIYPWPQYHIPNGADPDVLSAAAGAVVTGFGDITLGSPTIVSGDVDLLPNDPVAPACMVVNGCYVEVPWNDKFIPKKSFTVEAWVRVDWTDGDPHAWRVVLDMRERLPVTTGFAIFAKADDNPSSIYSWAAVLGNGSPTFTPLDGTEATITLKDPAAAVGTVFHLALTYEDADQTLKLFVNGDKHGETTSAYMPNAAQVLWIGAGAPFVARRPQPAGPDPANPDPASPLFPFVGAIQDVAIYKIALDPGTIVTHFHNGTGTDP
jgi:Concanavalin A-like lectin/glucanases superfamily